MINKMLWSDAWVLLAAIYAARDKPAPLEEVIAAADYIQHAIVTFAEMGGALSRLTSSGYLLYSDNTLSPTKKTMDFYNSISKPRRRVHDEEKDLEQFIGAVAWCRDHDPQSANIGCAFPALTHDMFNNAVKLYHSRWRNLTGTKK